MDPAIRLDTSCEIALSVIAKKVRSSRQVTSALMSVNQANQVVDREEQRGLFVLRQVCELCHNNTLLQNRETLGTKNF